MNTRSLVCVAAAAVALVSFARAQDATPPAGAPVQLPEVAPAPEVSTETILEVYGWFLGQQMQLDAFGLNESEMDAVLRGIRLASKGEDPAVDLQAVGPAVQAFLQKRPQEVLDRQAAEGKAEQEAFFAALDQNPAVKKTESGLRYEIVSEGAGAKPTLGDEVVAHYTGTFVDGKVFDSSVERGEPVTFPLNGVIRGWQEGMQLIGAGGKIKLYVPSALGYGDMGNRGIPPAKALVFEVELLEVRPQQPEMIQPTPTLTP